MKEYTAESIRNVALVSHSSSGKTMMTEAFLHFSGATTRLGKVEDGTTAMDYDEEEIRRGISIYATVAPIEYKNFKINFIDTPGYTDFVGEVVSGLRVADSAIILVDSVAGLEVGTEIAWDNCDKFNLPRFVVINKMNRENANFQKALASIQEFTGARLIPIQFPWGEKSEFHGVIDLLSMKAFKGDGKTIVDIPEELIDEADAAHTALVEAAAEGDDELMMKYFDSGSLTDEEVCTGLRKGILAGAFVPVLAAAGSAETAIAPLIDAIITLLPSPAEIPAVVAKGKAGDEELKANATGPLAAYVWKTTADPFVGKQTYFRVYSGTVSADTRVWNSATNTEERLGTLYVTRGKDSFPVKAVHAGDLGMVAKLSETYTSNTLCDKAHPLTLPKPEYPKALHRVAIVPKTQADSTKISPTLTRLAEEDPTLTWFNDPATLQTILQGMGDQHIDVAIRRADSKFQVGLSTEIPRVPYQENITGKGQASYRHKKQTGGSGQFGEVALRVEATDGEFEVVNDIFGGAISASYIPAIEKGIRSVLKEGVVAGYPVGAVRVSVYDGKEHPVDSKPIAFEIAGREAFKMAFKEANPVLIEPIMMVKIVVPEAHMGDVLGDMNTRRARVMGMETEKGHSTITAHVPLAEMLRYTTQIRSITGGRGHFTMDFDHYETVPAHITAEIIAQRVKDTANQKED